MITWDNLDINNIFEELDKAGVSWKIYYSVTEGFCTDEDDCPATGTSRYPATDFLQPLLLLLTICYNNANGAHARRPLWPRTTRSPTTKANSFCIDPTHIAPISQYLRRPDQ